MMDSKTKLQKALNHESGPLPVDFGSTAVTGIHCSIVEQLRRHYGLEAQPVKVWEPYQMLGWLDDDLKDALGVDARGILPPGSMFGFALTDWKEWRTPWGQDVLVPGKFIVDHKEDGYYIYPQGDTSAPPSGHLPETSYFFDTIVRQEPIDEDNLDPQDNLEEFGPYAQDILTHYREQLALAPQDARGVVANFPGTAFGDIALVPAPFLKHPKGIRDITEWYMSTAIRQDYIHKIFEKQLEHALANLDRVNQEVGQGIDVVFICGTDFGTQQGTFCSVDTFNDLWKPYYTQLNQWIHANTSWKTFKHSCGAIVDFVEPLIECGFDILNPVQCSAANMDPQTLKERFGDRITFWGGGVDTQQTLPFGTPDEVRRQVAQRCEIFMPGGGFVFNAIHNVQAQTPIENIVAMLDTVQQYRN